MMEPTSQNVPTPEQFARQMSNLAKKLKDDPEHLHGEMDRLMCELLTKLGYGKAVKKFDSACKWYG